MAGALEAWQQRPGVVSSPKRRASAETPPKRSWKRVAKMCAFARILLSTGVVQLPATILSALQRSRACEIILSPNPYPLLCRSLSHSHSSDVSSSIHSPFYILACFVGLMALLFCHLACLTSTRSEGRYTSPAVFAHPFPRLYWLTHPASHLQVSVTCAHSAASRLGRPSPLQHAAGAPRPFPHTPANRS